jgi:adenylate kinase
LLDTPEAVALKARGAMVGDREVVGILFRKLLGPEYKNGALLDGFPRTKAQVECLKLLFDEMIALRREFTGTADEIHFKKPIFHIMVLFVDEAESVPRQLKRGRQVVAHNEEVIVRESASYGRNALRTLAKRSLGIATGYSKSKLTMR